MTTIPTHSPQIDTASAGARAGVSTGFVLLDHTLGGGIKPESLYVIGGRSGTGKTTLVAQWAATIARAQTPVLYFTRERSTHSTLSRLSTLTGGSQGPCSDDSSAEDRAPERVGDCLWLAGPGVDPATGLGSLIDACGAAVIIVDGLRFETSGRTIEALKDLAVAKRVTVIATAGVDRDGLTARRAHIHHLQSAEVMALEVDAVIMLNAKSQLVHTRSGSSARHNGPGESSMVIFSVEKNRFGPADVDLEHRFDADQLLFDHVGGHVIDQLATSDNA